MLKSKKVPLIFILALGFAISVAPTITLHNHNRVNAAHNHSGHDQEDNQSRSWYSSNVRVNFISNVNSDKEIEEVEEIDDDDCLLSVPRCFFAVLSPYKLSFPTRNTCGSPSSHLLGGLSLRAPPIV